MTLLTSLPFPRLQDAQERLSVEEQERQKLQQEKRKAEQELASFKKDLEDMEGSQKKVEGEKTNKDHTIRNLNDQIAQQDETINKLNREKKRLQVGTGAGGGSEGDNA